MGEEQAGKNQGFFRLDEKGRHLFYPWGYPGEAFYIEEKQKSMINAFLYVLTFMFLITVFTIIFANFNILALSYAVSAMYVAFSWLYLLIVSLIARRHENYAVSVKNRLKKNLFFLWYVVVFEVFVLGVIAVQEPLSFISILFVAFAGAYTMCIACVLVIITKSNGYYFSKN